MPIPATPILYSANLGQRLEQITEATGAAPPTASVEVRIAAGAPRQHVLDLLKHIEQRIGTSKAW